MSNNVLQLLQGTLNPIDSVRKPCEAQLLDLESSSGYASTLFVRKLF